MIRRCFSLTVCIAAVLSFITFSAVADDPFLGPVTVSFTEDNLKELSASGISVGTNAAAEGVISDEGLSHDGDGVSYRVSHTAGKGYNSVENAVRMTLGKSLSGSSDYTISAWVYVPSEGNTDIPGKDALIGPGILINGNSGDNNYKYPTSVEEAEEIVFDQWQNVVFKTIVLGDSIGTIDFRFYTNDEATHPEIWYIDDIFVSVTADKPEILTESLDYGVLTVPYEKTMLAAGNKPVEWSVSAGGFPDGLEISIDGIISGMPEKAGKYSFTIKAENEFGSDSAEYSFEVFETDSSFTLTDAVGKHIGNSNPLYTQKFGADPWAMEYNGRLYVYMTNDVYEYDSEGNITTNGYGLIKHINVISSADLVNWTDHGSIPVAGSMGIAKWANNSWAPCAVWRNENGTDKFYLYFTNGGGGIGVLTGDSPVGPWTDPNGKALVSHSTENCSSNLVPWCFDPAVFIDDDGTGYLYFGGGTTNLDPANPKSGRVVKLKDNLTEIDGTPEEIAPPYFFEAAAMHKYNGKYYYSYSSNFSSSGSIIGVQPGSGNIAYMMSDNPMGPFTYAGEVLANPGSFGFGGGNNHQCIFKFKDEWYIAYHGSLVYKDISGKDGYRSTHIDKLTYNSDGTMAAVKGTKEGIKQLIPFDPFEQVEAETIAWNGGIETVMQDPTQFADTNLYVTGIENGDWLAVSGSQVDVSPKSFRARVNGMRGGTIELRTGSPDPESSDSKLHATIDVEPGSDMRWYTAEADLTSEITGTVDLFLVFKGGVNNVELFEIDWWQLSADEKTDTAETTKETETADRTENSEEQFPWKVIVLIAAAALIGFTIFAVSRRKK